MFCKITLILNFGSVFIHFAQNETRPFFCRNVVSILSWGQIRVFIWYYSLWINFRIITLFFNFRAVFVHFAQNETRPFFLSKFHYYPILGSNEGLPVEITLFVVSSVKYHMFLVFGQFSYTLPKTKLAHVFLSKLGYYLILGPNEALPVDITLFKISFVK